MLPGGIGFGEMLVIAVIAVLLFGSRLPEVARSVGQSYQHFRKGLTDIQSSIKHDLDSDDSSSKTSTRNLPDYRDYDDVDEASSPKFEPPPKE